MRLKIKMPKNTSAVSSAYCNNCMPQRRKRRLLVAMKNAKQAPAPTSISNKRARNRNMGARQAALCLPGRGRLREAAWGLPLILKTDHLPGLRLLQQRAQQDIVEGMA